MPDKLPIDPGKMRYLGLHRETFGHAGAVAQERQGVGTRHRLNRGSTGCPRPGKIFSEHPAAYPQWSDSGPKIGGRCYRRFVQADCSAANSAKMPPLVGGNEQHR
jgi:hypothetical protein